MSKNITNQRQQQELINRIVKLEKIVKGMATNQLAILVLPKLASDPGTPIEGQMWINTSSNTIKIYQNSTTKTVTTT